LVAALFVCAVLLVGQLFLEFFPDTGVVLLFLWNSFGGLIGFIFLEVLLALLAASDIFNFNITISNIIVIVKI